MPCYRHPKGVSLGLLDACLFAVRRESMAGAAIWRCSRMVRRGQRNGRCRRVNAGSAVTSVVTLSMSVKAHRWMTSVAGRSRLLYQRNTTYLYPTASVGEALRPPSFYRRTYGLVYGFM